MRMALVLLLAGCAAADIPPPVDYGKETLRIKKEGYVVEKRTPEMDSERMADHLRREIEAYKPRYRGIQFSNPTH